MDKHKPNERSLLNSRDIILILVLLVPVAIFFVMQHFRTNENATRAKIILDSQPAITIDLSKDRELVIESLPMLRFEVRGGAIAFVESDCPDQICVHSGFLHRPGHTAACLPNRVSLHIEWDADSDIDVIAH